MLPINKDYNLRTEPRKKTFWSDKTQWRTTFPVVNFGCCSHCLTTVIKIGGQTSKNHSLRSEKHRSTRVAAVSRLSDMKRANSSENGDECVPTKNNTNGHPQPPPHKRLNSANLEAQRMEKMGINGAGNGHADIDRVAVLDFGAQYGKVIDRRVREANVLSEMFPLKAKVKDILKKGNFKAIIISGGPNSVYVEGAAQPDPEVFLCGLPVLGICYGFQLINKGHGGDVAREQVREDGQCKVWLDTSCDLFHGLNESEQVLLTHGDSVTEKTVAPGFKIVARNGGQVAGIACPEKRLYGVQFHPEVDLTTNGRKMFENFLFRISGCASSYTMTNREQMCIEEIRKTVGDKKVLVLVSGGVDSSVCAALLNRAIGPDRITAIHIDNGFMRKDESDRVVESLKEINLPVHREYAGLKFMVATASGKSGEGEPLDRTTDPELKRQIIGNTFIRVKDRVMEELKLNKDDYFLAQGTLRPDLIESCQQLIVIDVLFRSYSYVAALSVAQQTIPWQLLARYANIIPKLLHNINRVVYVFGGPVNYPVTTITPTFLNAFTVKVLQEADHLATEALHGRRADGSRDPDLEDLSKKVQQ
ncbi:GMP synthase domain protein, partial [Teladorsagia circumcincta]